jgi:hypothetical protein
MCLSGIDESVSEGFSIVDWFSASAAKLWQGGPTYLSSKEESVSNVFNHQKPEFILEALVSGVSNSTPHERQKQMTSVVHPIRTLGT